MNIVRSVILIVATAFVCMLLTVFFLCGMSVMLLAGMLARLKKAAFPSGWNAREEL